MARVLTCLFPSPFARSLPAMAVSSAMNRKPILESQFSTSSWMGKSSFEGEHFFNFENLKNEVYRAKNVVSGSGNTSAVYGGLLFAQAMAAAEKTVPPNLAPNAIHSMFILAASPNEPVDYRVIPLRDGRSFCTRSVNAEQNGRIVFTSQISFHVVVIRSVHSFYATSRAPSLTRSACR
ncbi:hypothetical protein L596_002923 [Steinernema carpocapsae]|uniref:Acyl-CoA thioesterase-like N-terminal HotDog domain-containing protein n=1 Tax=Steinernema carpocapsae TaxID=34508 RepID=A0A4U8UR34_STECR|nr:hypothetical protein L596_002923 [Steinernema carpocapsae]